MMWEKDKNSDIKWEILDLIMQSDEFGRSKKISIKYLSRAISSFIDILQRVEDETDD